MSAATRCPQDPLHNLDIALQPLVLGSGRRPGAALGTGTRRRRSCSAEMALRPEVDDEECLGLDANDSSRPLPPRLDIKPSMTIDGEKVDAHGPLSDRSWTAHFRKVEANGSRSTPQRRHTAQAAWPARADRRCVHGLLSDGPAERPALNETSAKWADAEMHHAIEHWRRQFRGEARVKDDKDVTDADIASHNLVLWGDPSSNAILARIAGKLPVQWDKESCELASKTLAPAITPRS